MNDLTQRRKVAKGDNMAENDVATVNVDRAFNVRINFGEALIKTGIKRVINGLCLSWRLGGFA